jgi:Holliday junction resolvase RusA-like endonuclease
LLLELVNCYKVNIHKKDIQYKQNRHKIKKSAMLYSMEKTYTICGRVPSKKNSKRIIRSRKTQKTALIGSERYLEWSKSAVWHLMQQRAGAETIKQCQSVTLTATMPDRRRRDLTNLAESIMDALVDAQIIADDCWTVTGDVVLRCTGVDAVKAGVKIDIVY